MGKCSYCGKKSIFLKIDSHNLCDKCSPTVLMCIQRSIDVINESISLVNNAKTLDTRISRCELILKFIADLHREYISKGVHFDNDLDEVSGRILEKLNYLETMSEEEFIIQYVNNKAQSLIDDIENYDNAVSKHYFYTELIELYYKHGIYDKCIYYCGLDLGSLEELNKVYVEQRMKELQDIKSICKPSELVIHADNIKKEGFNKDIPAFKRLVMIYEKQKEYENAINVCSAAISCGQVSDGTKDGFAGRMEKLRKKLKVS